MRGRLLLAVIAGILWFEGGAGNAAAAPPLPLEVAGVQVVPHVPTPSLRYRRAAEAPLAARVQLMIVHRGTEPVTLGRVTFDGRAAPELLESQAWAWHNLRSDGSSPVAELAPGEMVVWTFNGRSSDWGPAAAAPATDDSAGSEEAEIQAATGAGGTPEKSAEDAGFRLRAYDQQGQLVLDELVKITRPTVWISTVSCLAEPGQILPTRVVAHIAHRKPADRNEARTTGASTLREKPLDETQLDGKPLNEKPLNGKPLDEQPGDAKAAEADVETPGPWRFQEARWWVPSEPGADRPLAAAPLVQQVRSFPASGELAAGDRCAVELQCQALPLTYGVLQLRFHDAQGEEHSLWTWLRIKREAFDISGGWVQSDTPRGNALTHEVFLKTLYALHINTAQINEFPGYTDQIGPEGLYTRYPLKYFNRCAELQHYDSDAILPRVHAVEFLGEPQYGGRSGPTPPQDVYDAFLPYQASRLPTSVTLSDPRDWHYYAGLSDYPHFDAYRVTAPAVDSWSRYDRWDGKGVPWGAPLETVGDMCRSFRELQRPVPVAYWTQGPHDGWSAAGRRRRATPTVDELRLQAYHGLSSRITSLYWFNLGLPAMLRFPDTLAEIRRINRECRQLADLYVAADAYDYHRRGRDGKPYDWDLSTLATPRAALLFAVDLDYRPDPESHVFRLSPPRETDFDFALPGYLRQPAYVYRLVGGELVDVDSEPTDAGLRIRDQASGVALYVATHDAGLGAELAARHQQLLGDEQALRFDPVGNEEDLRLLQQLRE